VASVNRYLHSAAFRAAGDDQTRDLGRTLPDAVDAQLAPEALATLVRR
jgi:hypothetical protein